VGVYVSKSFPHPRIKTYPTYCHEHLLSRTYILNTFAMFHLRNVITKPEAVYIGVI